MYVQRAIYDDLAALLAAKTEALRVGHGLEEGVTSELPLESFSSLSTNSIAAEMSQEYVSRACFESSQNCLKLLKKKRNY